MGDKMRITHGWIKLIVIIIVGSIFGMIAFTACAPAIPPEKPVSGSSEELHANKLVYLDLQTKVIRIYDDYNMVGGKYCYLVISETETDIATAISCP